MLVRSDNVDSFGDLNRRFRALDGETGEVLWETTLGSKITGYSVTYTVGSDSISQSQWVAFRSFDCQTL